MLKEEVSDGKEFSDSVETRFIIELISSVSGENNGLKTNQGY